MQEERKKWILSRELLWYTSYTFGLDRHRWE